jgi:hypothetical protein
MSWEWLLGPLDRKLEEAVEEEREEVRRLLVELRCERKRLDENKKKAEQCRRDYLQKNLDLEYSMSEKVGEMMTVSFQQRDAESLHESRVKEYKAEIARLTQEIGKYEN